MRFVSVHGIYFQYDLELFSIKLLYEKLKHASDIERDELWKIIVEKNRTLFKKRREELNKVLKKI